MPMMVIIEQVLNADFGTMIQRRWGMVRTLALCDGHETAERPFGEVVSPVVDLLTGKV